MHIGVPRKIKSSAFRVSVIPDVVRRLAERGREAFVEAERTDNAGFAGGHAEVQRALPLH